MPNRTKEAGAIVHLVEELGDARLRCDQLVAYVSEAMRLVENSPHKDHFFEVAGHILYAAPLTLQKLQKSLQAVALAANQIDSEELKNDLRPEKVQQIEQALENVRIRQIRRRSEPTMITPQYVAEKLRQFAATARETQLPQTEVAQFIAELEGGQKVGTEKVPEADMLERFAQVAEKGNQDYGRLAAILRRMVGDVHVKGTLAALATETPKVAWEDDFPQLNERAFVIAKALDTIKENGKELLQEMARMRGTPMYSNVTERGLSELVKEAEKARHDMFGWGARSFNKEASAEAWKADSAKTAGEFEDNIAMGLMERILGVVERQAKEMKHSLETFKRDPGKNRPQLENFKAAVLEVHKMSGLVLRKAFGVKMAGADEEKQSRFEEGKPADPTENMSPEDAKKWKEENEKHKDKFKAANDALLWKTAEAAEDKQSRFEEGKPADPTENMSPEDAKKWKEENEKNRDKFKTGKQWTAESRLLRLLTCLDEAEVHLNQLIRETPHTKQNAAKALHEVEVAAQIAGRDIARDLSLPSSITASEDEALQWKAGAEMAPKFDPSFQQQLSLMMRNPPKVSQVEGMFVIEIFSPFVKKYIPQAEYTSAEAAQKDLNVWMKAHRETVQNLRGAVRSEGKTASLMEFFKPDADWWQGFLEAGRRNHAWIEAWKADEAK